MRMPRGISWSSLTSLLLLLLSMDSNALQRPPREEIAKKVDEFLTSGKARAAGATGSSSATYDMDDIVR